VVEFVLHTFSYLGRGRLHYYVRMPCVGEVVGMQESIIYRNLIIDVSSSDTCDEDQNQEKYDDVRLISRTNKMILN
jgi:hypothetical protein